MGDVAEKAGVSVKTVSRVINEEPGVAVGTSARVAEAIAALGFHRNDLARSLRHGHSSSTLGLVIEDVANPFYSAIAEAVENVARERGYLLITGSCQEDPELERELVTALLRRRVDAMLIVPAGRDHTYLRPELGPGTPAVFLDRPPSGIDADCVLNDDRAGARTGTAHLITHGHTRIACLSDTEEVYTARERRAGYGDALADAGITQDPHLVPHGQRSVRAAEEQTNHLLSLPTGRRPSAFFCANNRNTIGALRALRDRSLDAALVGFDDFELAELLSLTVVRSHPSRLGKEAAALTFARLDGDRRAAQRVVVPTELIPRGSGELTP